jgi:hypothetical protein
LRKDVLGIYRQPLCFQNADVLAIDDHAIVRWSVGGLCLGYGMGGEPRYVKTWTKRNQRPTQPLKLLINPVSSSLPFEFHRDGEGYVNRAKPAT